MTIEVESLAGAVARRLQGERRRAVAPGRPRPAEPFPVDRLASAITRQPWRIPARDLAGAISHQLGNRCGRIAIPTVLRAIGRELSR